MLLCWSTRHYQFQDDLERKYSRTFYRIRSVCLSQLYMVAFNDQTTIESFQHENYRTSFTYYVKFGVKYLKKWMMHFSSTHVLEHVHIMHADG
ncbi:unnamed protein product [Acanthoscelides obtectus]|uniref:Uncharacterized protein n=1 Tax=Acanthoscelides obtectus TaxID=200917 RepID=A0A9P0M0S7_ACAOB|nr:unnamed protein product [Acanthoscelides obtectus]CAK1621634.1 hypothetical protein AOBTE_LOCUS1053 [Acanthoscelides obtectus]